VFQWLSDQQEVTSPVEQTWYDQGSTGRTCLVLKKAEVLASQSCVNNLRFICQIDAGNPCDVYLPGGDYHNNSCFLSGPDSRTLQDAKAYCERQNAKVVEP
ncbi:hypothetical protein EGW08_020434, partial [Elysia chlorotica]